MMITRENGGAAIIHIETFMNGDWDSILEERDHVVADLGSAIAWLADNFAVAESELRAAERPRPRG